jgi:hypothetical protein
MLILMRARGQPTEMIRVTREPEPTPAERELILARIRYELETLLAHVEIEDGEDPDEPREV